MPFQQYRYKFRYNDATEITLTRRATSLEIAKEIGNDLIAKLNMGHPRTIDIQEVKHVPPSRTT